ncbi:MAG: DUF362 domain-containing protein [Clostridiales bacterium]|nr:DUF362 domain-containing protein [Clostridiales bacterium]
MRRNENFSENVSRRDFFRKLAGGLFVPYVAALTRRQAHPAVILNDVFWVKDIPDSPFYDPSQPNLHIGLDSLLYKMADAGLKFYRSTASHSLAGVLGLIAPDDVVLIKVNAQWKYRGATNSDLVRGLIQRILDHPDGFTGEVVIFENGQGRGSLACDTSAAYGDSSVHANANDEKHSFLYLVNNVFNDPRVSAFLLDPVRGIFIGANDHTTNGYRRYENVSYPCFTTSGGRRVELREGIWLGNGHSQNLKLINVPVLKHHDTGGSEITVSLKHYYGVVSMDDGHSGYRHYAGLGETCGKMMAAVVTPVLNIVDAIWVSHGSLTGYPAATTFRANQLLASQDPVAADYWAAKYILYPIDGNFRHHPDFPGIERWLAASRDTINSLGGLKSLEKGIVVDRVTKSEAEMNVRTSSAGDFLRQARISLSSDGLSFVAAGSAGGKAQERTLAITVSGSMSFAWWTEKDVDWLGLSPASGMGNGKIGVRVDASGLAPGKYTGRITIHCREAANSPLSLPVRLTVVEGRRRISRNSLGKF